MSETFGRAYERWLDPKEIDERECDVKDCEDGIVYGVDANGSEVSKPCESLVHLTAEEAKQIDDDFKYEMMREEGME